MCFAEYVSFQCIHLYRTNKDTMLGALNFAQQELLVADAMSTVILIENDDLRSRCEPCVRSGSTSCLHDGLTVEHAQRTQ